MAWRDGEMYVFDVLSRVILVFPPTPYVGNSSFPGSGV